MDTTQFKPIFSKDYLVCIQKDNKFYQYHRKITITHYASFCVKNTEKELIAQQLKIVAKQNGMQLTNPIEIALVFDLLRECVSWN